MIRTDGLLTLFTGPPTHAISGNITETVIIDAETVIAAVVVA